MSNNRCAARGELASLGPPLRSALDDRLGGSDFSYGFDRFGLGAAGESCQRRPLVLRETLGLFAGRG